MTELKNTTDSMYVEVQPSLKDYCNLYCRVLYSSDNFWLSTKSERDFETINIFKLSKEFKWGNNQTNTNTVIELLSKIYGKDDVAKKYNENKIFITFIKEDQIIYNVLNKTYFALKRKSGKYDLITYKKDIVTKTKEDEIQISMFDEFSFTESNANSYCIDIKWMLDIFNEAIIKNKLNLNDYTELLEQNDNSHSIWKNGTFENFFKGREFLKLIKFNNFVKKGKENIDDIIKRSIDNNYPTYTYNHGSFTTNFLKLDKTKFEYWLILIYDYFVDMGIVANATNTDYDFLNFDDSSADIVKKYGSLTNIGVVIFKYCKNTPIERFIKRQVIEIAKYLRDNNIKLDYNINTLFRNYFNKGYCKNRHYAIFIHGLIEYFILPDLMNNVDCSKKYGLTQGNITQILMSGIK